MTRRRLGPEVLQLNARAGRRERVGAGLGPLDEDDGTVEVRLEIAPLGGREAAEAVEVEVRHVHDSRVAMPDRERRARHARRHAERPRGTADERRLPDAELAGQEDDVAGSELAREARRQLLGLLHRAALDLERRHPASEEPELDGLARSRLDRLGGRLDGGSLSPRHRRQARAACAPRSSGSRATSRSSTSSIVGV